MPAKNPHDNFAASRGQDARAPEKKQLAAIVLAAGASTRLGRPKQLLELQGKPLVVRACEAISGAGIKDIVVVVGANAAQVRGTLAKQPVRIVENPAWAEGMGASIRAGIAAAIRGGLAETALPAGVLIALCDQPYFSAETVKKLLAAWRAADGAPDAIVAARYAGHAGVPAIFGRNYFAQLRALAGAEGAKPILSGNTRNLRPVDLPELAVDVDTPEDWARLG